MSVWLWLLAGIAAVLFFGPGIIIVAAVVFVAVWLFLFMIELAVALWPFVLLALLGWLVAERWK